VKAGGAGAKAFPGYLLAGCSKARANQYAGESFRFRPILTAYCLNLQVHEQARQVMFGRSIRLRSH